MLVDIHTHIFPPEFIAQREHLAGHDPAFGAIYGNPRAAMAAADDLHASMREASVDVSVACGFWWSDAELAEQHTNYLVAAAAESDGAILAFVPSHADTLSVGAAGIGEVREASASDVPRGNHPLLVHCSEEAGHEYPGKSGGLTPGVLWQLIESRPDTPIIAAHWGGGFPFYGLMPEVRERIDQSRILFDTAASHYLYRPEVFSLAIDLVGAEAIAWGSDFPLRRQAVDLTALQSALAEAGRDEPTFNLIAGGNAARFLGLPAAK